jgi:Holliday junction resolvase RusA-like endonuclease
MKIYKFIIPGKPIAWQRAKPSYSQRMMFDSQKKLKRDWAIYLLQQYKDTPIKTCISLDVTFFMPPADKMKQMKKDALCSKPHFYKPDLSNMIKWVEDCCNGIVFDDDCLIASISAKKIYDLVARTEFTIQEL